MRQAAAQTQIAQQQYNVQREAIDNRTNAAYIKYMQTYTELDTQRKSVELARQNYNVVNARYLGQLQEVDARINILYAYYQLKYVAGDI